MAARNTARLSCPARELLADAVADQERYAYSDGYKHHIDGRSARTAEDCFRPMQDLVDLGLVEVSEVPCEDAEDPVYYVVPTARGLLSYAKAKAAGLVK